MKKTLLTTTMIGAITLTTATVALADHHYETPNTNNSHAEKMMEHVDTNGDGMVSKEEFLAKHEKMFAKIDTDGNGLLSPEELKSGRSQMQEKRKSMKEKMMERKQNQN